MFFTISSSATQLFVVTTPQNFVLASIFYFLGSCHHPSHASSCLTFALPHVFSCCALYCLALSCVVPTHMPCLVVTILSLSLSLLSSVSLLSFALSYLSLISLPSILSLISLLSSNAHDKRESVRIMHSFWSCRWSWSVQKEDGHEPGWEYPQFLSYPSHMVLKNASFSLV